MALPDQCLPRAAAPPRRQVSNAMRDSTSGCPPSVHCSPYPSGLARSTRQPWSFTGALFLEYLFAECWFGPTIAGLQAAAPANAQGLITGVFSCLTFVGNLAPFLIGLAVSSGDYEMNQLLAISVPVLYGAAAVAFVAAGQTKAAAARDSR